MQRKRRAKGLVFIGMILLILMTALFLTGKVKDAVTVFSREEPAAFTIVIDAGHGGMDGGAVGVNGSLEKDINLSVALKLENILNAFGYHTAMTRREDISIHDDDIKGTANQKKSDLHNRLALMEEYEDCLVISIHQNNFTQSRYDGAQMFYGKNNPESKVLAGVLQSEIVSLLQPGNTREIKPAGKEIFLLYQSSKPIVLAECGFLSNPQEEALLQQEEYQRKMAFAIASAIMKYRGQQPV